MSRIADPLRAFVTSSDFALAEVLQRTDECLLVIADEMDREHERRMDQSRNDMRKATCRYMARVVEDYKHGRKWQRKEGERCAR